MLIEEITEGLDEKRVWRKSGKGVKLKTRCASGPRKGQAVSSPSQCHAGKNIKKSQSMKKTRARQGSRIGRVSRRSKKYNPASKQTRRLNK